MTVRKLAESKTKLSTDLSTRILTLKTHDGFTVSFAVSDDQFKELARAAHSLPRYEAASPTSQEKSSMLPLLALHAIAAQRGDGLRPVLLAGLKRLATERAEHVAAESGRDHGKRAVEPTADRVTREEAAKPKRAA